MEFIKIANQFAERTWEYKDNFSIDDIMLYGSLARGSTKPKDIDLMIIHKGNALFEEIQNLRIKNDSKNNLEIYAYFLEQLKKQNSSEIDFFSDMNNIKMAFSKETLNVQFLDGEFINNLDYFRDMNSKNDDPNFYNNIFSDGFLWNPNKKLFSIKASEKYYINKIKSMINSLDV